MGQCCLLILHENISAYPTSKIKAEPLPSDMKLCEMYRDLEHVFRYAGNIEKLAIPVCCNPGPVKRKLDGKYNMTKDKSAVWALRFPNKCLINQSRVTLSALKYIRKKLWTCYDKCQDPLKLNFPHVVAWTCFTNQQRKTRKICETPNRALL